MKKTILFSCFILAIQLGFSQANQVDAEHIKTIIFKPVATNAYAPIIKLGEKLKLLFDDLHADEQFYSYKIEHYTFDWIPSNLSDNEFVDGYAEDRIRDFENSFNTLLPYTNYQLTIPNESTKLIISGNYMLSILNEDQEVVFKRKFVVYESKVDVGVAIYRSRDIATIQEKQSVEFSVNYPNFRINNPSKEIMPTVIQNNNWQTEIRGLKPQFYRGNQLLYKYDKETSFWGGNEFLYFDSKSIRNTSLNIVKVELGKELYHTFLYTNDERIDQPYTYYPDINGNFTIRTLDGQINNTDADYSWVHFSLKTLENLDNKSIYIQGNFNDWQLNNSNKLTYNFNTGLYETMLLLKQGFYNYQYVTKTPNGKISNHDIDGSYYETENEYTVLIYYKEFGSRYDRVIGVGYANSEKINN